jgi:hypothetical protein
MIDQDDVLVQLIRLIDRIPTPPPPPRSPRGRPIFYSERLFLKALLIMIVKRLHKVGELLPRSWRSQLLLNGHEW